MTRSATSSSLWSTRLALYEVSPTFAKLQDVLETPEMYNGYGDPETGELNSGGIHWVLRKAAWTAGYYDTARTQKTSGARWPTR